MNFPWKKKHLYTGKFPLTPTFDALRATFSHARRFHHAPTFPRTPLPALGHSQWSESCRHPGRGHQRSAQCVHPSWCSHLAFGEGNTLFWDIREEQLKSKKKLKIFHKTSQNPDSEADDTWEHLCLCLTFSLCWMIVDEFTFWEGSWKFYEKK